MMGRMENEGERRLHHPYLSVSQTEKRERGREKGGERKGETGFHAQNLFSLQTSLYCCISSIGLPQENNDNNISSHFLSCTEIFQIILYSNSILMSSALPNLVGTVVLAGLTTTTTNGVLSSSVLSHHWPIS